MNAKIGSVSHTWLGTWLGTSLGMALLALGLGAAGPLSAQDNGSYGYIRTLEGPATLMQRSGDRDAAEINQPLLAGDHLIVPARSRAEIVLADRNIVRIDGGTELQLERLAGSPDTNDLATVLRLAEGNLQLVVVQDSLGENLPRIDTQSATIYVKYYGNYRITADRDGWSEVVVRRGKAEVVTDRGSAEVRADERAVIDAQYASVNVQPASGYDTLERWAQHLDSDFNSGTSYVDDNLRYAAAPLNQYGSWISYNNQRYWRPHVDAGWRPYWHGRWQYTPAGLTWVAYEPWGWVPYHYGTWDYLPAYGWAWQPGYVWAPAWVYWYWGPTYTSWCPVGYYTHYYGSHYGGHGFRWGVYGWAGGHWDNHWDRWNWIRNDHIGRHDQDRHAVPIDELRGRMREVPRGVITTDTQGLTPDTWRDHGRVERVLGEKPNRPNRGHELPDVTSFIDRKPDLPPTVVRTVADEKPLRPVDGTPLRPSTMGRRPAAPGEAGSGRVAVIDRDKPTQGEEKPRPRIRITDEQPGAREVGGTTRETGRIGRPAPGSDGGAPRPEANGRTDPSDRTGPSDSRGRTVRSAGGDRPEGRPSEEKPSRRVTPDEPPSTRGAERPSSSTTSGSEPEERRTVRRPDPADDDRRQGRQVGGAGETAGEKPRSEVRSRRPDPADDGSNRANRMEGRIEGYPMPNREERPGSGRSSVQSYDRPEWTRETPSTRRVEPARPETPVYVPSYRQPDRPETSRRSEPTERPRVEPPSARPSARPEPAPQREAAPSARSGGDSRGGDRGGDGDGGGRRAARPPRGHD